MRDVSQKVNTLRTATASAVLNARASTITAVREGSLPKGDALTVAKVAAIQAAKNTPALIPYCHPVPVDFVGVEFLFSETSVEVRATVKAVYKTGVEMEALAAATVAVLTIYDMTKMIDEEVDISAVRLLSKKGGKSDFTAPSGVTATVVTVSDTRTASDDESGPRAVAVLEEFGVSIVGSTIVRDDPSAIEEAVRRASGKLIVLTGGTGVGPRDNTPEVVARLIEKELPGVSEQIRRYGQDRTPMSMLSRSVCGVLGDQIVLALPGSPGGVEDGLRAVLPSLLHVLYVLTGAAHA